MPEQVARDGDAQVVAGRLMLDIDGLRSRQIQRVGVRGEVRSPVV